MSAAADGFSVDAEVAQAAAELLAPSAEAAALAGGDVDDRRALIGAAATQRARRPSPDPALDLIAAKLELAQ